MDRSPAQPPRRRIAVLQHGARYWVFPQLQGALDPLLQALDLCQAYHQPGDHFVFLGSQIGVGGQTSSVIEALVSFRNRLDQASSAVSSQVIWLRGVQEELLDRFYTLHFAQDPLEVLEWMVSAHGFDHVLSDFGVTAQDVAEAISLGAGALARFTAQVRETIRNQPHHGAYFDACARAAVSDDGRLLFVHAGVDPARSLSSQTDAFWWGHPDFFRLQAPFLNFAKVISTLCPEGKTHLEGPGRLALDSGAGRGGVLRLSGFDPNGEELFAYRFH